MIKKKTEQEKTKKSEGFKSFFDFFKNKKAYLSPSVPGTAKIVLSNLNFIFFSRR